MSVVISRSSMKNGDGVEAADMDFVSVADDEEDDDDDEEEEDDAEDDDGDKDCCCSLNLGYLEALQYSIYQGCDFLALSVIKSNISVGFMRCLMPLPLVHLYAVDMCFTNISNESRVAIGKSTAGCLKYFPRK